MQRTKTQDPKSRIRRCIFVQLHSTEMKMRCTIFFSSHMPNCAQPDQSHRVYDLSERTAKYAINVCVFLNTIPKTIANVEYTRQLIRSSASIGANYLEANDALGAKDFAVKIKTSRREAKESAYWFRLLDLLRAPEKEARRQELLQETQEFVRIFSAMLQNFERNQRLRAERLLP